MTISCPSSIKACAMRVTRLNDCSIPLDPLTPNSRLTTSGFMEINLSPDVETGENIIGKNGCGAICVRNKDCDRLMGYDVEIKFCGVPLPAIEMLLGYTLLADVNGNFSGFASRESKYAPCSDPVMLEFWSENANKGACTIDGTAQDLYLQWLLATSNNWEISGGLNFTMGQLELTITGYAENNPLWFPSFPGEDFPSWTPGGGDPTGVPTGAPPPVLPPSVDPDVWTLADQADIQDGGPLHMKLVPGLPAELAAGDLCNYVETGIPSS